MEYIIAKNGCHIIHITVQHYITHILYLRYKNSTIFRKVMSLAVPSHYLNQCWTWDSGIYTWANLQPWYQSMIYNEFENYNSRITATPPRGEWLWSSDAIWRLSSGSTLVQVMAWCLTAPSHYLRQFWLIIRQVLWRSSENNFTRNAQYIYPWYEFENYILR